MDMIIIDTIATRLTWSEDGTRRHAILGGGDAQFADKCSRLNEF